MERAMYESKLAYAADQAALAPAKDTLRTRMRADAMAPHDVPGDDHCQMRSAARQLRLLGKRIDAEWLKSISHVEVRRDAVQQLRKIRQKRIGDTALEDCVPGSFD
eukprot:gene56130-15472_t